MITIQTHDKSLHGIKYCIADNRGNIIDISSTTQSQARAMLMLGEAGDKFVTVLFRPW